jgi:D-arabinonate dehydratase/D-galactarolactone cycloisomerase
MLGGAVTPALPAVTSAHPHGRTVEEMVEAAVATTQGRTQGYKFGMTPGGDQNLGHDQTRDVAFVQGLRDALGPDALIVADARAAAGWDVETAARRADAFNEIGMLWLEEPLEPWDRTGYRALKSRTRLKLGYGEREWTEANYDRVIEDGLSDVVGLDHGRVGGVTASWRIACKVRDAQLKFNSHAWSGSILSAVGLAISCASGAALLFELKPLPDAMQTEMVEEPLLPVNGVFWPPGSPGVGVTIREGAVAAYGQC